MMKAQVILPAKAMLWNCALASVDFCSLNVLSLFRTSVFMVVLCLRGEHTAPVKFAENYLGRAEVISYHQLNRSFESKNYGRESILGVMPPAKRDYCGLQQITLMYKFCRCIYCVQFPQGNDTGK